MTDRKIRMLNLVDEFIREALAIRVARRLNSNDVIDMLSDLFILRRVPAHICSDNGPIFITGAVQEWIRAVGAQASGHHTCQSAGKRIHRKLQCSFAQRTSERRDLLFAQGSQGADRSMATPRSQYTSPRFTGVLKERASGSAWTAGAAGWTTSSSIGCGGR